MQRIFFVQVPRLLVLVRLFCGVTAEEAKRPTLTPIDGAKTSWQAGWREDVDDCVKNKRELFINKKTGKPRTRRIEEIPEFMTELIMQDHYKDKRKKERKQKAPQKKGKLTKKERMQQELLGSMGEVFAAGTAQFKDVDEDKEYEATLLQYGKQTVQQMIQRSRLPPNTELTLREFCDMVWRAGSASPLDYDQY